MTILIEGQSSRQGRAFDPVLGYRTESCSRNVAAQLNQMLVDHNERK